MKRCTDNDKQVNDKIYEDNLDAMDTKFGDFDPFEQLSLHIGRMATCVQDIADIYKMDPSIALGIMAVIPLAKLQKRHSSEVFESIFTGSINMTSVDPTVLLKAIVIMLMEKDGKGIPDGVDIHVIAKDNIPTKDTNKDTKIH